MEFDFKEQQKFDKESASPDDDDEDDFAEPLAFDGNRLLLLAQRIADNGDPENTYHCNKDPKYKSNQYKETGYIPSRILEGPKYRPPDGYGLDEVGPDNNPSNRHMFDI